MDCGDCLYGVKSYYDLECRRYPQRVGVMVGFWCGEYVARSAQPVVSLDEIMEFPVVPEVKRRGRPKRAD